MKKSNKDKPQWEISFGFYPGILLGMRSYSTPNYYDHVLYMPLIDICLTVYKYN